MANHVHLVVGVMGDPDPEKLLHRFKIMQLVAFPELESLFVKPRLELDGEFVVHLEDRDFQGRVVNVSNYPHVFF